MTQDKDSKNERPFHVTYEVHTHPEGIIPRRTEHEGACDSIMIFSIAHSDGQKNLLGGGTSTTVLSRNGYTEKELTPEEQFTCFCMLASHLSGTLSDVAARLICEAVINTLRDVAASQTLPDPSKLN